MLHNFKEKEIPYKYLLFSGFLFLLIFSVENINGHFLLNDFKVYYNAASALMNSQPVYNVPFGLDSGYYKYSPFSLFLFFPYLFFSFDIAKYFHFIVITIITISSLWLLFTIFKTRVYNNQSNSINLVLSLSLLCVARQLTREMHLGNINLILLALSILAIYYVLHAKKTHAAFLLSLIIITKPYLGIIMLPLIYRKEFKILILTTAFILIYLALPILITGYSGNIILLKEWGSSMFIHNSGFYSAQTFSALLFYYFSIPETSFIQFVFLGIIVLTYLAYLVLKKPKNDISIILEWFILLAIIPNIFKTDTQQFIFILPLVLILIMYLTVKSNTILLILFSIVILIFGWNSSDIVGHYLSYKLDEIGMIGICNLCIIAMTIWMSTQLKKINFYPSHNATFPQ